MLFVVTCAILVQLFWRYVSQGWAACLGMMALWLFSYLKVLDRLASVTDEEREARRRATQRRRAKNTAFWGRLLEAKRVSEKKDMSR